MRNQERIECVLEIIKDAWIKNPDLRLCQLIWNVDWDYYTEDYTLIERVWDLYDVDSVYWGTYWIDGNQPLTYLKLSQMSTSHIRNILKTQGQISKTTRDRLLAEYLKRNYSV